jgi:hypothetical protein
LINFHLEKVKREKQEKPKASRRKDISKPRIEIMM